MSRHRTRINPSLIVMDEPLIQDYSHLHALFGTAVDVLRQLLLQLDDDSLHSLLERYARLYGESAADRVRDSYPLWQSGMVPMPARSLGRLFNLLPAWLSDEQRQLLLQQVIEQHRAPLVQRLIEIDLCEPGQGYAALEQAIDELFPEQPASALPARCLSAARWLCDADMQAARTLLEQALQREFQQLRRHAQRESRLLQHAINTAQVVSASYRLHTRFGSIEVSGHIAPECALVLECFGPQSRHAVVLRLWRDYYLSKCWWGRLLLRGCARYAGRLAELARHNEMACNALTRLLGALARRQGRRMRISV